MTKIRPNQAAILFCLGLMGASILPVQSPPVGDGGILSAVIKPLRMIQREAIAQENISPSHVYQRASDLISEIEVVREAMGVTDYPLEAEPAADRSPIHVYGRTLELRRKISAAQRRLGMAAAPEDQIPVREIQPKDVIVSVQAALAEVLRIKEQLVIEDEIEPAPLEGGKTPSHVYQHIGDASFMMDGLVGHPTDINDVYRNVMDLHGDMELVAAKLKVALELDPPEAKKKRRRLKEIGQQMVRATFKLVNLQTRLGMDASGVPQLTLVRVTPANLYEVINLMDAEMVRIKVHLGVLLPHEEHSIPRNKRPRDVFLLVRQVIRNLDLLAKAADGYVEIRG